MFFNFKQYACFFVALFIIQTFYGLMSVSNANNNEVEYAHVQAEYDYHVVLRELNLDQLNLLVSKTDAVFKNDLIYKIVRIEENLNYMTNRTRYNVYLFFNGDKDVSNTRFRKEFLGADESGKITQSGRLQSVGGDKTQFSLNYTALFRFDDNKRANLVTFIVITLVLLAVSIFLLTALYKIRVNQYKFTYGVYMTFGADFKKLFGTAFWELFVISIVTLIPAVLVSTLVVYFIYRPSGFAFHFSFLSFLLVGVFNLIVVLASVWMPMRIMSIRQPMSLIITEDNSNYVTSPMRSINLLGKSFPTQYEYYSLWRFRKYSIQLLTTAIVFCALFIMGLYYADIYQTDLEYPRPQFTIDLSRTDFAYDDEMSEELYALSGVREVKAADNNIEAIEIASHMITDRSNVRPFKNIVVYNSEQHPVENARVTNDLVYTGLTEEQLRILEKYEYSGDLNSLFTQPNTVIIGDAISNVPTYRFEVGDTIEVAVKVGQIRAVDTNLSGRNLLKSQIQYFRFEYHTFTVGAVLHNVPSSGMPIYFTAGDYETITGKPLQTTAVEVYVDQDMTPDQISTLESEIRNWGRIYGEVRIVNTHRLSLDNIAADKHYNELYICIAILILFISPLVWFFTQTLYYFKREKEFNILQAMGALVKDIRHIYLQGGIVMAVLSLIVAIVLSYIGSYALFYVFNVMVPYFAHEPVRYAFYMPWYAIVTSIVMSVSCGFLSTYLPFRSYIKSRFTLENGVAGEGDEGH